MDEVRVEATIAASPEALYDMVSDVTRMGRWSSETTGCRWLGGATGPAVGARFRGANRHGWRRWSTSCVVTAADRGREFSFDVGFGPWPISRWEYRFEADPAGCRVVESWTDRRPRWMISASPIVMGVPDRPAHNRQGMVATLARLREAAETRTGP